MLAFSKTVKNRNEEKIATGIPIIWSPDGKSQYLYDS